MISAWRGIARFAFGNDGTDRGVFGGFGFAFNMTGEPAMAEVTSLRLPACRVAPAEPEFRRSQKNP